VNVPNYFHHNEDIEECVTPQFDLVEDGMPDTD
jgi:hypothetical protein